MTTLEQKAAHTVVAKAQAAGVDIPTELAALGHGCGDNTGARLWAKAHPDADTTGCCWGDIQNGPTGCTCWKPIYDMPGVIPETLTEPADVPTRARPCGDCAYRANSPERTDTWIEEELMELAVRGQRFYCHQGMRRPVRWAHPDGRTVPGAPDDWQPLILAGVPYRAFGQPALICAGWATRAARLAHAGPTGYRARP